MPRDGFLIPNASTYAPDYQTAQPDQGDFVILGNSQYGVVSGCKVALSGGSGVSIGADTPEYENILVVDGKLRLLGAVPPLSIKSADATKPRFDLVVYSLASGPQVLTGTPSANPVFPDIDTGVTVLAAVYVPAGTGSTKRVIDKRNFLQTTVSAVGADATVDLVSNRDTVSDAALFHIDGTGKIEWGTTSAIEQDSTAHLKVTGSISVPDLAADTSITVDGNEVITEDRISWGTTQPTGLTAADKGKVFVNTNTGDVEVYRSTDDGFQWIALETAVPPGTVIQSFVDKDTMRDYGWLLLDGSTYTKVEAPNLWNFFISWRSGDNVVLPDMTGRFPLGNASVGYGNVGDTHGDASATGSTTFTISESQMPSHSHRSGNRTGDESHSHTESVTTPSGSHNHGNATQSGGGHFHTITDKNHSHPMLFADFIVTRYDGEGDSCLDIKFVDQSHHWVTQTANRTFESGTGITSTNPTSGHTHGIPEGGQHTHSVTISNSGSHSHSIPEHSPKGGGQPITLTPPSMNIYFYIKM